MILQIPPFYRSKQNFPYIIEMCNVRVDNLVSASILNSYLTINFIIFVLKSKHSALVDHVINNRNLLLKIV